MSTEFTDHDIFCLVAVVKAQGTIHFPDPQEDSFRKAIKAGYFVPDLERAHRFMPSETAWEIYIRVKKADDAAYDKMRYKR